LKKVVVTLFGLLGARNDWPPGETVPLALPRYAPVTNQELL